MDALKRCIHVFRGTNLQYFGSRNKPKLNLVSCDIACLYGCGDPLGRVCNIHLIEDVGETDI